MTAAPRHLRLTNICTKRSHVPHASAVAFARPWGCVLKMGLRRSKDMAIREPLITTSPGRLSGTPVFAGTRVPVQTLIAYLEAGDPLDHFLRDFPSVSREHTIAVLELAKSALLAKAVAA